MDAKRILILNGPNLNLVGKREPETYGNKTFEDFFVELKERFSALELHYFQSNIEGELITQIQDEQWDGIVLNAGAYTHTSIGIRDAISAVSTLVVEVHISNTHKREDFRHVSYISSGAKGVILGFGLQSYDLAIQSFL